MNKVDYFFPDSDKFCNPEKTIKYCFNVFYNDGFFIKSVYYFLVKKESFYEEGCYWLYPEEDDVCQDVIFEIGFNDPDWIVKVPKLECFKYTKMACERFLEIHTEIKYKKFLEYILNTWNSR